MKKTLTALAVIIEDKGRGPYQVVTWSGVKYPDRLFSVTEKVQAGKTYEIEYAQNQKNPKYWNVVSVREAGANAKVNNGDETFEKREKCLFLNTCLKAASEITAAAIQSYAARPNATPEDIESFAELLYAKTAKKIILDFKVLLPFQEPKSPEHEFADTLGAGDPGL